MNNNLIITFKKNIIRIIHITYKIINIKRKNNLKKNHNKIVFKKILKFKKYKQFKTLN